MKQTVQELFDMLFIRYPQLKCCHDDIYNAYQLLKTCYQNGGKVLVCGNGGSASDSDHIVGELMKGFLLRRPDQWDTEKKLAELFGEDSVFLAQNLQGALPAINLAAQSAIQTAYANDVSPEMVFAQQVFGYAVDGDVLIGISTSGNSKNVFHAARIAKLKGASVITLTGAGGGKLHALSDAAICVPETETFKVQELHLPVYHTICAMIEEEFFGA